MRTLSLIALSCVTVLGCKKKEPAKAPPPAVADAAPAIDAAPPVDAGDAALTPAVPAGKIGVQVKGLQYEGYEAPGLPAIRDDGSAIAALAEGDDGGRGYLDLRLRILDGTTGAVTSTIVLADPDETSNDEAKDGDMPGAIERGEDTARTRVAEANAQLAQGTWRSLATTARGDDDDDAPITAGDLTFTYDAAKNALAIARAGKTVATHSLTKQVPKPAPAGADSPCGPDEDYLHAVHTDAATKRILVEIGFRAGGHNCGAGGAIYAVVPLP